MVNLIRLGINIDHVATLRNARGGAHPDPVRAALIAARAGADGITAHLREDRRHIRDEDIRRLKKSVPLPLNLEMAAAPEMLKIALNLKPHAVCLVPEKRKEVTTEGGLNVAGQKKLLLPYVAKLKKAGIRVSLFIDPVQAQVEAAASIGAPGVELHTGSYALKAGRAKNAEFKRLVAAASLAQKLELECHAGHGLTFDNVMPVAGIPQIAELNIGHFLVGEALFLGLGEAVRRMKNLMRMARK